MEEIVNLIGADESASEISDKLKDVLYGKAAERIQSLRPAVGASMFDDRSRGNRRMILNLKGLRKTLDKVPFHMSSTVQDIV